MHRLCTLFCAVIFTSSLSGLAAVSAEAQSAPTLKQAAAAKPHSAPVTAGGKHLRVPRSLIRLGASSSAAKLLRPRLSVNLGPVTADIQVNYSGFPLQAKAAFQAAVDIWKTKVVSPTPILIDANWSDLTSQYGPGVLGSAGPTDFVANFNLAPRQGVFYPVALANAISGVDQEPPDVTNTYPRTPDGAEISADFNSNESGFSWYYGTDGLPTSNKVDLETVVLHELGHGLGFLGSFEGLDTSSADTGHGYYGLSGDGKNPTIFDALTTNTSGVPLMSSTYPSGSTALGDVLRGASGGPHWGGAWGIRGSGALARPTLYAPGGWQPGSSFSHLDESTYAEATANALMTPVVNKGEADHGPGPIMLGMFRDMGWPAPCTTSVPVGSPSDTFHPVTPTRIYTASGYAGRAIDVPATGLAGVPLSGVDAVAVNVEVYKPKAAGSVQVLPGCSTAGAFSSPTQQFEAQVSRLQAVVVRVNREGGIRILLSQDAVLVDVDISGWYGPGAGDRYHRLPARWVVPGGVIVNGRVPLDQAVLGRGGLPSSGVDAVVLTAMVSQPTASAWLIVSPGGTNTATGTQAFTPNQTISNLVVVRLGTGLNAGKIRLRITGGTARVALEVVGWYGPGSSGMVFHPGSGPVRLLNGVRAASATISGLPPSSPVMLGVAAGNPSATGWLGVSQVGTTAFRGTQEFIPGRSISGLVTADVDASGQVRVRPSAGVATLSADMQGWFANT